MDFWLKFFFVLNGVGAISNIAFYFINGSLFSLGVGVLNAAVTVLLTSVIAQDD